MIEIDNQETKTCEEEQEKAWQVANILAKLTKS